jgi:histone H3/H4
MDQHDELKQKLVIPGLTRNPVKHLCRPAFAGMTRVNRSACKAVSTVRSPTSLRAA